jgi:hypothetical protein
MPMKVPSRPSHEHPEMVGATNASTAVLLGIAGIEWRLVAPPWVRQEIPNTRV